MICFQISIFAESHTLLVLSTHSRFLLWFAFKLVSLQSHIHLLINNCLYFLVVICFQISIFAESHTLKQSEQKGIEVLWFAFKLVSLQSHIHFDDCLNSFFLVVICFQISIFAESHTLMVLLSILALMLWFAFKLVSLQSHIHWIPAEELTKPSCDLLSN